MNKIKVGDIFTTNKCGDCRVLEYINNRRVKVRFITTGYECWCVADNLRKGQVKDLYSPLVRGVGYIGEGRYLSKVNGKQTKEYNLWICMLGRCYNIKGKLYHRYGGRGITVCKEWHNFQNFAKWCNEQPNYNKEGFELDKDLRIKDSKEYSPNTCSFVPQNVNTLLVSSSHGRGAHPVGVYWSICANMFISRCHNGSGRKVFLGYHQTSEEAFQVYKEYKENLIKRLALEEYNKGNITEEVYNNLLNWEVVPFPE